MPIPTPPVDKSGGILIIGYQSSGGGKRHRMRVHICGFNPVGVAGDYAYTAGPLVGAGEGEANVANTAGNLMTVLSSLWDTSWTLAVDGLLWVPQAGNDSLGGVTYPHGVPVSLPPPSAVAAAAVAGAGSVATTAFEQVVATAWNQRSLSGGRAHLYTFGVGGVGTGAPVTLSNTSGGTANERNIVGYLAGLVGSASAIVAHDGARLAPTAHLTFPYNRRSRARAGFA